MVSELTVSVVRPSIIDDVSIDGVNIYDVDIDTVLSVVRPSKTEYITMNIGL